MITLKNSDRYFYNCIIDDFEGKVIAKDIRFSEKEIDEIEKLNSFSDKYNIKCGATKVVLIPKDNIHNYVIKIPLGETDCCCAEDDIYHISIDAGLEGFFAPTHAWGIIGDRYTYLQLKLNQNFGYKYPNSAKILELPHSILEEANILGVNKELLVRFLEEYSISKVITFVLFLKKYYINDLHSGNYGYYCGKPMVFDFPGYGRGH